MRRKTRCKGGSYNQIVKLKRKQNVREHCKN